MFHVHRKAGIPFVIRACLIQPDDEIDVVLPYSASINLKTSSTTSLYGLETLCDHCINRPQLHYIIVI